MSRRLQHPAGIPLGGPARRRRLTGAAVFLVALFALVLPASARSSHQSDLNKDGVVDLQDVILFSQEELGLDWQQVDWCTWITIDGKEQKHVEDLIAFIDQYFDCDPLSLRNANNFPTRATWGPFGRLYVSDAKAGSVFVYDVLPALTPVEEFKNIPTPLGVVVDGSGNLFVGSDGRDSVMMYAPDGRLLAEFGAGTIGMANYLALGGQGDLIVVDSRANRILVYDIVSHALLRTIGEGELNFPAAIAINGSELYVADQRNFQVKVYDLAGNLLRAFGRMSDGFFGYKWKGRSVRLQSLDIDSAGRLHVLDGHMAIVQVLEPTGGTFCTSYGSAGTAPGELRLPLDIALIGDNETAVANAGNKRVELIPIPAVPTPPPGCEDP
jgi:DNA-binding beta-propeller fold protein YncE